MPYVPIFSTAKALLHSGRWTVTIAGAVLAVVIVGGCPPAPPPTAVNIGLQLVAEGLTAPVDLAAPPDGSGRLFVVDQPGRIRIIDAGGALLPTPFLDVTDRVVSLDAAYDERGLLGMAFHPDYAANGRFFVFYNPNNASMITGWDNNVRVSEFHVSGDPNIADAGSEIILLTEGKPAPNHNGGQLAFDPDGFLLISIGDGGGAGDSGDGHNPTIGNAQDKSSLLGKILRIDVDAGSPYGIPADNPFVSQAGVRPEIYVLGARNPWRLSIDSGGARRLFVADVGQNLFEEVSIAARGDNLGWRLREGTTCFDPASANNPPAQCPNIAADGAPLVPPILQYPHSDSSGGPSGVAVIGGIVYRGAAIPGLVGRYLFGDWSKSFLFADGSLFVGTEAADGSWTMEQLGVRDRSGGRLGEFLLGMGRDSANELYLLTSMNAGPSGGTGKVYKIVP